MSSTIHYLGIPPLVSIISSYFQLLMLHRPPLTTLSVIRHLLKLLVIAYIALIILWPAHVCS